jgi:hypothetical protein
VFVDSDDESEFPGHQKIIVIIRNLHQRRPDNSPNTLRKSLMLSCNSVMPSTSVSSALSNVSSVIQADLCTPFRHPNYAQRILTKFDMETYNPTRTPFESTVPVKAAPCDQLTYTEQFCTITSSIMHPVYTRPDIVFTVSKLAQFSCNLSMQHSSTAKHILRWIRGLTYLCLIHVKSSLPG